MERDTVLGRHKADCPGEEGVKTAITEEHWGPRASSAQRRLQEPGEWVALGPERSTAQLPGPGCQSPWTLGRRKFVLKILPTELPIGATLQPDDLKGSPVLQPHMH